jgi:hypothetical protein
MCDYSLGATRSRSAEEGERLVVYRFPNGVQGFVSSAELCPVRPSAEGFWNRVAALLSGKPEPCAVCLQPGTRLILRDLPVSLCQKLGLQRDEEVTIMHREVGAHKDGVLFRGGRRFLIQWLPVGLEADVLSVTVRPILTEPNKAAVDSDVLRSGRQ